MDKGIIWDNSQGYPAHVLSWHEMNVPKLGNIRIWIHSKGAPPNFDFAYGENNKPRVLFTFGSIEIQIQGRTFTTVTEQEKQLRLELATYAPLRTDGSIKSSNFRFIPVGQLEIDHMQCIKACYDKEKFVNSSTIRIVKSDKVPTLVFKNGIINKAKSESVFEKNLKIFRTTQNYAIAVAKLYSDLSQMGTQKIIKQISIDTGLPSDKIYTALRVARSQGWLTSRGVGKSGGTLSSAGAKAFLELNGQDVLDNLLNPDKEDM